MFFGVVSRRRHGAIARTWTLGKLDAASGRPRWMSFEGSDRDVGGRVVVGAQRGFVTGLAS